MATMNYHSVGGLLIGETDALGSRRDYLTDALGSVTATVDQTAAVRNTYRYVPYGGFAATTTPEAVSRFTWTGETGSLNTRGPYAEHYNRTRFYGRTTGRWSSVDPLWPSEPAYTYVRGNPTTWTDPSGTARCLPNSDCGNFPGGPCAYAASLPPNLSDLEDTSAGPIPGVDVGGVVCCNGVGYACAWAVPPGLPKGIKECVLAHEDVHVPGANCILFQGYRRGGDADPQAECKGYAAELTCLSNKQKRDCNVLQGTARDKCLSDYQDAIKEACTSLKAYPQCQPTPAICL